MCPTGRSPEDADMRPLIGVFTSERHAGALGTLRRCEGAPEPELRLGTPYLRAVEAAGGLPVVLAPDDAETAVALLDRLDGLCLAGGPDLDPLSYGSTERHEQLGNTDLRTDGAELALARAADRRGMPVLGICRGAQALCVARGGTLRQHVDDHRQTEPARSATHEVRVRVGSRLARLAGTGRLGVNSFHHQAADELGTGLRAVAHAPDGTIEAIEDASRPFVLGVQWHAEAMVDRREQFALFAGLVDAAARPRLALAA
jgi:putative glutamine amidotransferase